MVVADPLADSKHKQHDMVCADLCSVQQQVYVYIYMLDIVFNRKGSSLLIGLLQLGSP